MVEYCCTTKNDADMYVRYLGKCRRDSDADRRMGDMRVGGVTIDPAGEQKAVLCDTAVFANVGNIDHGVTREARDQRTNVASTGRTSGTTGHHN